MEAIDGEEQQVIQQISTKDAGLMVITRRFQVERRVPIWPHKLQHHHKAFLRFPALSIFALFLLLFFSLKPLLLTRLALTPPALFICPQSMQLPKEDFFLHAAEHLLVTKEDTQIKAFSSAHCCHNMDTESMVETANVLDKQKPAWSNSQNDTGFKPCIHRSKTYKEPPEVTNGYIMVNANGGLNQMRNGICDMVAIARIMNSTLVIPYLDHVSFWRDLSEFKDIFDVSHFIKTLAKDVRIVESIPASHSNIKPFRKAPISWSKASYYRKVIFPLLKKHQVIHFTHSDSRLSNNDVPPSIQKLRCRTCYEALKFSQPILQLGQKLVERLRSDTNSYIALHLRYERDMLAFTGCTHGLNWEEAEELSLMRYNTKHWKEKEIDGEERRRQGGCPLTPAETALVLKGLGYPPSTKIYIAAGEAYGSRSLEALRKEYPSLWSHTTLAREEEMEGMRGYQNRQAALDYIVAMESEVFLYTYNGNMAKAVQGHRKFAGLSKAINLQREEVVKMIDEMEEGRVEWREFEAEIKRVVLGGEEDALFSPRKRGDSHKEEDNFYANPLPGCICQTQSFHTKSWESSGKQHAHEKHCKYDEAAEDLRGSFTPLVISCDGVLHKEYKAYLKRLANRLALKWSPYSLVIGWVRTKVDFSLIHAINLRLRGSRKQIRPLGLEDGAALSFFYKS